MELEKVHIKYFQIVLGVHRNLSNVAVYGETVHFQLLIRQNVKSLKYWSRTISIPDQSLVKLMYTNLLGLNIGGFKTWVTNIENMVIEAGLTTVWDNQACSVGDIHNFKSRLCGEYSPSTLSDGNFV